MPKFYEKISVCVSKINFSLAVIAASILAVITGLIVIKVLLRYLAGVTLIWTIEVSEYALLFITFLGAPYLLETNRHVVIDLIYDNLTGHKKYYLGLFTSILGTLLCLTLSYAALFVIVDQYQTGVRYSTILSPQKYWITAVFPPSFALMAFLFFDKFLQIITTGKPIEFHDPLIEDSAGIEENK